MCVYAWMCMYLDMYIYIYTYIWKILSNVSTTGI